MTSPSPTIYDVARAAGVSISTVSNALNRPDRVSPKTRARILECIDEMGFVPKSEATTLARKQMRRIGVIAPFTSYVSYMTRLSGVLAEAGASGFEVATFDSESAATSTTPILDTLPIKGQVDGLIVMGFEIDAAVEIRLAAGETCHEGIRFGPQQSEVSRTSRSWSATTVAARSSRRCGQTSG